MTRKEVFTAAVLGIIFGVLLGIGFDHAVNSFIDQAAIRSAMSL